MPASGPEQIDQITQLLRDKLGVRAADFPAALERARRRLPRRVYRQGQVLARAAPLLGHPKLGLTVKTAEITRANQTMRDYLESIDLADQRKGWWLGVLGTMAFNLLAVVGLTIAVLVWRGVL